MEFFDQLFYKVLTYYQERAKKGHLKQALSKAIIYISFLELTIAILLLLLVTKMVSRSYAISLSSGRFWATLLLLTFGIYFFNVLQYNAKRRMKIRGRMIGGHKKTTQIWKFWIVPFALLALSIILSQAF